MLTEDLVDELRLLVHPCLAGPGGDRRWYDVIPPPSGSLELASTQTFEPGLVWLRYHLRRECPHGDLPRRPGHGTKSYAHAVPTWAPPTAPTPTQGQAGGACRRMNGEIDGGRRRSVRA